MDPRWDYIYEVMEVHLEYYAGGWNELNVSLWCGSIYVN